MGETENKPTALMSAIVIVLYVVLFVLVDNTDIRFDGERIINVR